MTDLASIAVRVATSVFETKDMLCKLPLLTCDIYDFSNCSFSVLTSYFVALTLNTMIVIETLYYRKYPRTDKMN